MKNIAIVTLISFVSINAVAGPNLWTRFRGGMSDALAKIPRTRNSLNKQHVRSLKERLENPQSGNPRAVLDKADDFYEVNGHFLTTERLMVVAEAEPGRLRVDYAMENPRGYRGLVTQSFEIPVSPGETPLTPRLIQRDRHQFFIESRDDTESGGLKTMSNREDRFSHYPLEIGKLQLPKRLYVSEREDQYLRRMDYGQKYDSHVVEEGYRVELEGSRLIGKFWDQKRSFADNSITKYQVAKFNETAENLGLSNIFDFKVGQGDDQATVTILSVSEGKVIESKFDVARIKQSSSNADSDAPSHRLVNRSDRTLAPNEVAKLSSIPKRQPSQRTVLDEPAQGTIVNRVSGEATGVSKD